MMSGVGRHIFGHGSSLERNRVRKMMNNWQRKEKSHRAL